MYCRELLSEIYNKPYVLLFYLQIANIIATIAETKALSFEVSLSL
jgi:hypothetical protein